MTDHIPPSPSAFPSWESPEIEVLLATGKVTHLYRLTEDDLPRFLDGLLDEPARFRALLSRLPFNDRNRLLDTIESQGERWGSSCLDLIELLMSEDLLVYDHVCSALAVHGWYDPDRVASMLRPIAFHEYPKARDFAAEVFAALMVRTPTEARMILTDWSMAPEPELREVVARTFRSAKLPLKRQDYGLLEALSLDDFSAVRVQVARAMHHYLDRQIPEAFPVVERLARDNRWETAAAALEALGHCGSSYIRQALRLLRGMLHHEQPSLRTRAAKSLRLLAQTHPRRTFMYYRGIARDRDYLDIDVLQTVLLSMEELARQDYAQAAEVLHELTKDRDEGIAERARAVLATLPGGTTTLREGSDRK